MEDRPKKRGKRNFFTPNQEEKESIKIKKMESKIKKKEDNLKRLEKIEKKIKTEKESLAVKVESLKTQSNQAPPVLNNLSQANANAMNM